MRRSRSRTAFTGFGRAGTEDAGRFELVTVKPGRVPWVDGRLQAPHLVDRRVRARSPQEVATRMYFPDEEEANAEDPVLPGSSRTSARRSSPVAEDGGLRFDIALQGAGQTTFFAV